MPVVQAEVVSTVALVKIPEPVHAVSLIIQVKPGMEVGLEALDADEAIVGFADNKDIAGDPEVGSQAEVRAEGLLSLQADIPVAAEVIADPALKNYTRGVTEGPS
jgi:hypothetical protein